MFALTFVSGIADFVFLRGRLEALVGRFWQKTPATCSPPGCIRLRLAGTSACRRNHFFSEPKIPWACVKSREL